MRALFLRLPLAALIVLAGCDKPHHRKPRAHQQKETLNHLPDQTWARKDSSGDWWLYYMILNSNSSTTSSTATSSSPVRTVPTGPAPVARPSYAGNPSTFASARPVASPGFPQGGFWARPSTPVPPAVAAKGQPEEEEVEVDPEGEPATSPEEAQSDQAAVEAAEAAPEAAAESPGSTEAGSTDAGTSDAGGGGDGGGGGGDGGE